MHIVRRMEVRLSVQKEIHLQALSIQALKIDNSASTPQSSPDLHPIFAQ